MEQFETSVSTVMSFLNEENFSASVISLHRLCYRAIATYLSSNMLEYSPDIGYQWIAMYHGCWNYRKYTGFKHCIDQLNDVFLNGKISLDHLSPRLFFASTFWTKLQNTFGHCCMSKLDKVAMTRLAAQQTSRKPLQSLSNSYSTRYGNGSSEFSSSCACSLK